MELQIVQTGALVLRERAPEVPVEEIRTPEFQQLIKTMIEVMRAAPGVGLAAPQIGVQKRVFVMEDEGEEDDDGRERVHVPTRVFVNPVLKPIGEEKVTFFEGCLSVEGFSALVPRWREVEVSGLDENAKPVKWRVKGWPARILQHETDHLDGTLYIDRMLTRSFTENVHVKNVWADMSVADVKKTLRIP